MPGTSANRSERKGRLKKKKENEKKTNNKNADSISLEARTDGRGRSTCFVIGTRVWLLFFVLFRFFLAATDAIFFAGVSPDPVEESFLIESYVAKLNLTPALRQTICEEDPKISE